MFNTKTRMPHTVISSKAIHALLLNKCTFFTPRPRPMFLKSFHFVAQCRIFRNMSIGVIKSRFLNDNLQVMTFAQLFTCNLK